MLTSGDVVHLDLGAPDGREAGFRRPAVVVTAQQILEQGPSIVHVVPLSTTVRGFGSEVELEPDALNGLELRSVAQCQHIRAVSPQRLIATRGSVGSVALAQIRETLSALLDIRA